MRSPLHPPTPPRPPAPALDPAPRRAYVPPAIISREKLEGIAGVCDPSFGGKGDPSCGTPSS